MRDKIEEMPTITSVLGISMGDEGKGRVVHELSLIHISEPTRP